MEAEEPTIGVERAAEPAWVIVQVMVDPATRSMKIAGGLPNEVQIEMLSRALRYVERQALLTDLKEALMGPRIVGANGTPAGQARRFTG